MPADFVFTDEHEELRKTVRAFLQRRSDDKAVRAAMASERGYDAEVWKQLAEELGLVGLIIPEQHGGAGFGAVELLVAMEEMGRALLCAPFLGTSVFAAQRVAHVRRRRDAEGAAAEDRFGRVHRLGRACRAERTLGPRGHRAAREGHGPERDARRREDARARRPHRERAARRRAQRSGPRAAARERRRGGSDAPARFPRST